MGKNLIQQRRGRRRGRYTAPSHRFKGEIKYNNSKEMKGVVEEIIHDPGRTSPVAKIRLENNKKMLVLATEGIEIGHEIKFTDAKGSAEIGNILSIGTIPEGYPIYNIEITPGDGGKLVRAGGSSATVVSHTVNKTVIKLPSGQFKTLDSSCRATIGMPAGGGRKDKPLLKAGKKYIAFKKRGKQYPIVRGVAMNPVSHPHGGGGHQHVGKPSSISRGAPPGKKVGNVAAKRSGRR
ncbi:MAG: 50S ribosomal protein L2 [Thermoplasmatales archaeon]|nr:MAG: 50S ribosomal protein L2 [Thermoplasmatales archaeon]